MTGQMDSPSGRAAYARYQQRTDPHGRRMTDREAMLALVTDEPDYQADPDDWQAWKITYNRAWLHAREAREGLLPPKGDKPHG